ncbi:embryonic polarity protein dorsal [Hyalella azteca]|uniref:Embryonic polarity protein dorsal n=1 Tax=Hyalella azteca TaxID=294128 RepID=A0A979FWD4_HYAAZ|nr:embryonic polarity protein dorsal [Hyalella azteca]
MSRNELLGLTKTTNKEHSAKAMDSSTSTSGEMHQSFKEMLEKLASSASGTSLARLDVMASMPPKPTNFVANPLLMKKHNAFVEITEQPSDCGLEKLADGTEGSGTIKGLNSTLSHTTCPAIRIMEYYGPAIVLVSCVSADGPPHYPHPLELRHEQGKEPHGVYVKTVALDMTCKFTDLSLDYVVPSCHREALHKREQLQIDPFRTGFKKTENIDGPAFRLCFQVFLEGSSRGQFTFPLPPVVSRPLHIPVSGCNTKTDTSTAMTGGRADSLHHNTETAEMKAECVKSSTATMKLSGEAAPGGAPCLELSHKNSEESCKASEKRAKSTWRFQRTTFISNNLLV